MSGEVDRGVFLTASTFTQAADRELERRGGRVVLITGKEPIDLIDHWISEDFLDEL